MDNLAEYCGECEYCILTPRDTGFCNRVDDPDFVFPVSETRSQCLYERPGFKISREEQQRRKDKAIADDLCHKKHMEQISKMIDSWPEWKRNLLGAI
jgi:hypothetical protein